MSGSSDMGNNRELHFTVGFQQPQPQQPPQPFRVDYSDSPVYQTPPTNGGDSSAAAAAAAAAPPPPPPPPPVGSSSEPLKRKRGRPRKYGLDGVVISPATTTPPVTQPGGPVTQPGEPVTQPGEPVPHPQSSASAGTAGATVKRPRGRPRGSLNKKGTKSSGGEYEGSGLTTHVLTVKAGEDLAARIMLFSQSAPRNILILSANGSISNATIRQPSSSGGTVTYEGRFEILSLVGSFLLAEGGSQHSRAGALGITLSGPDGRVLGGAVAGLLIAAAPIQVVLGSFTAEGHKQSKSAKQVDTAQPRFFTGGQSSSPSGGSESSGGLGSALN